MSDIAVPVQYNYLHGGMHFLSGPAAILVAEAAMEKGLVLDETEVRCQEIGDGELAVGVFAKGETNPGPGNALVGLVIPWGFWRTTDGRVTEGAMTTIGPPSEYAPPANQRNIALVPRG
jgi:hypothetical protein